MILIRFTRLARFISTPKEKDSWGNFVSFVGVVVQDFFEK